MTDEGAGGRTMAYCHQCQALASMAGDSFIHLDGTPLCKEKSSMTEHLPECWATHESDPPAWCICDELRACEQRVLDAARDSVAAIVPFEFWEGVEGRPAVWCVVKADVLFALAGIKGEA